MAWRSTAGDGETEPSTDSPFTSYGDRGVGVADMAAAIVNGRPHRASAELALHVLETMCAIETAVAEGREVIVESTFERSSRSNGTWHAWRSGCAGSSRARSAGRITVPPVRGRRTLPVVGKALKVFHARYDAPSVGRRIDHGAPDAFTTLLGDLEENGFGILAMGDGIESPETVLKDVAGTFGLGEPVTPILYRRENAGQYAHPYRSIRKDSNDTHPGFSTTEGQLWHVDGLLEQIGALRITILYCVRAAHTGGDTLIFNAVAAFDRLRAADPEAAAALTAPNALERRATLPGVDASTAGPVFAVQPDGGVINRFTDNDTCVWNRAAGTAADLDRGLEFLRAATRDPRYATHVTLGPGELLMFRNDWISHGRTAYQDTPDARRHLVRALYSRPPCLP